MCAIRAGCGYMAAATAPAHAETEALDSQVGGRYSPGSFYKVRDLHFGVIVAASTLPGTVTVAPNGTRTSTGGVTLIGNSHYPAEFAGMKPTQPNRPVRMRVGSNTVLLTGPGAPMVVSLFRANTNPAQTLSTIAAQLSGATVEQRRFCALCRSDARRKR
jgi:hypothetical protein